eukprot:4704957-Pleurochrysis_carterae.AAC.8
MQSTRQETQARACLCKEEAGERHRKREVGARRSRRISGRSRLEAAYGCVTLVRCVAALEAADFEASGGDALAQRLVAVGVVGEDDRVHAPVGAAKGLEVGQKGARLGARVDGEPPRVEHAPEAGAAEPALGHEPLNVEERHFVLVGALGGPQRVGLALLLSHVEPDGLRVGVGQRERHRAADALAFRVPDHQTAEQRHHVRVEAVCARSRQPRRLAEQLSDDPEVFDAARDRRRRHAPDVVAVVGAVQEAALPRLQRVRLVDDQPIKVNVPPCCHQQECAVSREDHIELVQMLVDGLLLLAGAVVGEDSQARREFAQLVLPLAQERVGGEHHGQAEVHRRRRLPRLPLGVDDVNLRRRARDKTTLKEPLCITHDSAR